MMLGLVPSPAAQQIPVGLGRLRAGGFEGLGIAPASCATSNITTGFCTPTTDCSVTTQWLGNPACWGDTPGGWAQLASQSVALPAPSVPLAPTQAQIDAVQSSSDPGTAAQDLAQSLSDQAVTETQANVQAAVSALPTYADSVVTNPLGALGLPCGTGSTQWISGVDNCVLLGLVAVGIIGFVAVSGSRGRR